jgi:hypothetical protein
MAKKTPVSSKKPAAAKQAHTEPKQVAAKPISAVKASAETAKATQKAAAPAPAKAATPKTVPAKAQAAPTPPLQPSALIETLAKRRQDNLNEAMAQLHALQSQMLHAAGRHANTALQFLNSAPKSGTLSDMIEWQSRWFLSHAHVNQDGMKALGSLASKNIEQLQKTLRVDMPRMAG